MLVITVRLRDIPFEEAVKSAIDPVSNGREIWESRRGKVIRIETPGHVHYAPELYRNCSCKLHYTDVDIPQVCVCACVAEIGD